MNMKNRVNNILRKFGLEVHGLGYLQSLGKKEFQSAEMDILLRYYGNEKITIYDVGANKGLKVEEFKCNFPSAFIHAFEPFQTSFEILSSRFGNEKNIILNNFGISDEETILDFNVNKGIDTSSFLKSKSTGLSSDGQVKTMQTLKLPVTTLDSYTKKNNQDQVQLLKLDIQGSELNALRGATQLLKQQKIDFIFSETYFIQQYVNQPLFHEIAGFLNQFGYIIQDLYHPVYGDGRLAWCDTMFVRNDIKLIN